MGCFAVGLGLNVLLCFDCMRLVWYTPLDGCLWVVGLLVLRLRDGDGGFRIAWLGWVGLWVCVFGVGFD